MIVRETPRPCVEDTRERIFNAAREIFALKGPHGTTTREIADRAGVNEATLFRHFGNKSALLDAMKEWFCQNKEERLREMYDSLPGEIEADLKIIGRFMIEGMTANKDLIRVALLEEAADPEGVHVPWRMPKISRDYLTKFLESYVARGELHGDPVILARIYVGYFFAYIMGSGLWKQSAILSPDEAVDTFVNIFLNGARSIT
ncbi:MAG: TetR/AcrR family transcriptional regulator [Candidatus Eremiobacteraeota bacterium]|nr:TetR/AcrR family transcriptional regulator [Candidatus Eremiobacteraeota bacterium]